jgi:hypothetical protein
MHLSILMPRFHGYNSTASLTALFILTLLAFVLPPAQSQGVPAASPQAPANAAKGVASPPQAAASANPGVKPEPKKAKEAYKRGLRAEQAQDWQAAHDDYADAVDWAPTEREYLLRREVATSHLVQAKVDLAERDAVSGRLKDARRELIAAAYLDPTNSRRSNRRATRPRRRKWNWRARFISSINPEPGISTSAETARRLTTKWRINLASRLRLTLTFTREPSDSR